MAGEEVMVCGGWGGGAEKTRGLGEEVEGVHEGV